MKQVPREHPFLFGVTVTSAKTAVADMLTQTALLNRHWTEVDLGRVSTFALYGALYLGCVQYWLFVKVYPRLLPLASRFAALPFQAKLRDGRGFLSVLAQVGLDQGLHWPLTAVPAFYYFKGLGEGEPLEVSLAALREHWRSDVLACWAFWLPADALSFGLLPTHLQVPFAAMVSFAYTVFVSSRRGEPLGEI
jgi:hypothetical protein